MPLETGLRFLSKGFRPILDKRDHAVVDQSDELRSAGHVGFGVHRSQMRARGIVGDPQLQLQILQTPCGRETDGKARF